MGTADGEVLALGLWLPCGQASFFHSSGDKDLIPTNFHEFPLLPLKKNKTQQEKDSQRLQCSVFRRLFEVLGSQGYDVALPLYPKDRIQYIEKSDPDAAIFYSHKDAGTYLENLILIVNSDGFYIWITPELDSKYFDIAKARLEEHIWHAFGGDYYSRFSGITEDKQRTISALGPEECAQDIKSYTRDDLGILTFFQVNTILEGLYNYSFDPTVFFAAGSDPGLQERVNNQRKRYNIGSFVGAVQEEVHGIDFASVRDVVSLCHQDNGKLLNEVMGKGRWIVDSVLDPESQVELIRKFLRSTANEMLQRLKWRIEGCRRALLDDMLTVTHRHQPLIQVELPDSEDHEAIRRVSEAQLRGYVMLVGAKLPLITNIQHYLDDVIERLEESDEYKSVERFYHSWISLLRGLKTDLEGLEQTIRQSTTDKIVYEEEQVRAEQEMIGELELLRQREDAGGDGGDSSVEALLAAIALVLGLSGFEILDKISGWGYLWLVPLVLTASIAIYLLFLSTGRWTRRWIRDSRWAKRRDGRFYYKADLRLELRLSKEGALLLFGGRAGAPEQSQGDPLIERLDEPRHSSYRIERSSKDTSVQKVHLERELVWKKGPKPKARFSFSQHDNEDRMIIHLIYEIVFNRLVSPEEFILYELRTVAIHRRPLEPEELIAFRRLIGSFFINRLLAEGEERLQLESDALLALPTK